MIAIVPAAGLGTRMAQITHGRPKELLSLGRRSVLQRIVDEALEADADEVIVISSPQKPELDEAALSIPKVRVVHQTEPRGLADAVLTVESEDDVLVMLGDCAFHGGSPSPRMATLVFRGIDGCIAVEEVSDDEVSRYGICEVDGMGSIRRILEKPSPMDTSSRHAVAARFAFTPGVWSHLRQIYAELGGPPDLPLTPILQRAIDTGVELKAVAVQPGQTRADCGTPEEYASARRLDWS